MKTETIVMCVVALLLGMLIANMLKSVCGCNAVVEGQGSASKDKKKLIPGSQAWIAERDRDTAAAAAAAAAKAGTSCTKDDCNGQGTASGIRPDCTCACKPGFSGPKCSVKPVIKPPVKESSGNAGAAVPEVCRNGFGRIVPCWAGVW